MSLCPADLQMANFQIREREKACAINTKRSMQAAAFRHSPWSMLICSALPMSDCADKPGSILHDPVAGGGGQSSMSSPAQASSPEPTGPKPGIL